MSVRIQFFVRAPLKYSILLYVLCACTQNGSDCRRRDRIGWKTKKFKSVESIAIFERRRTQRGIGIFLFFLSLFIRSRKRGRERQRRCRLPTETVSHCRGVVRRAHANGRHPSPGSGNVVGLAKGLVVIFQNVSRSKRNHRRQDSEEKNT